MFPWIEKYRPENFTDLKLKDTHQQIFKNIINTNFFPHMLFYGPPGTGKTTAIMCLLKSINEKYNYSNNVIHLNASDDRGIDVIRNLIYTFVNSSTILNSEKKFVVLDEIDSMTKIAQNSLLSLINNNNNVHFCLICNYISKLTPSLRNKCVILYFYNANNYTSYLKHIIKSENIKISDETLSNLIKNNDTDIRSMVNSLQQHKHNVSNLIKYKDIESICLNYKISTINKYKHFYLKDLFRLLFTHMVDKHKIDFKLISMMKTIIYNPDIQYFDIIFMPYFIQLQN
jgi:DNA polymerase III delta prime subunit